MLQLFDNNKESSSNLQVYISILKLMVTLNQGCGSG